jgi:signal transduction histidine kinase/ActR/RegA family two-component response regulator
MPNEDVPGSSASSIETRVLILPPTGADGLAMGKLFDACRIAFALCKTSLELCTTQRAGAGTLILSEEALLAESSELLACIASQPVWSDLPVIVLSRSGRESVALAAVISRLGNVTVVERPIRTSTLIALVRSTLRARGRQYQVREYLAEQEQAQKVIRDAERRYRSLLDSERAARSQAERASRTKDEFLATLSHELRTPLNAVLGWTQVLRRSRDLPQDAVNGLNIIERNARSQAQIIADLLDMSSIISGKVRLDVQRLDLAAIVKAAVETVKPAALAKAIRLQVVLDPRAGPVRGDPNRLQQVFWNLLINAMKFTRKDGRVAVTLARVNSHLEVEISDNGEGIDPAFLPYVFDRFRQADASSARRHGGLGLGLSIVKQLVELHGGAISAKSAGRDLGATFRVSLPLMATSEDALGTDVSRQHPKRSASISAFEEIEPSDLTGVRVLVVDDEPDARSLIQRLLQDCHAIVVTAGTAEEAVQMLLSNTPDVLVSDIGMPGEDGYTLIRRIRSLTQPSGVIPAIALTAYARIEDRVKAIHAGFQLHLSKPVEPVELVAMVRSLARRPSLGAG